MISLVRYLAVDVLRGQRYLAPLLVFLGVMGMLFSADAGQPLEAYSGSSALLYPIAAWMAVVVATSEDVVRREITVVTAGGWPRVLTAAALVAVMFAMAMAVLAAVWPVVTNPHPYTAGEFFVGLAAHTGCALLGVGVGLLFARPVLDSTGRTVLAVFSVVVLTYPLGRATPLGWVLDALGHNRVSLSLLGTAAVGVALVAAAVVAGVRRA
ncbi:hypothetical protein [Lentzea flaviverrucosa]|uniref:ABC-2 type transport system permease protein n=1 Tax=Lentzea flaviverrucosa TaxID=200379 RepID=A0A1H9WEY4_9PSEU|nr:hypothetical protein [Lentzea flaviverrucosa]RDI22145.1 hypothetical protein DFR72_11211 [Lentzea flaviverrucosa]SES32482.1 hypothetical protein SAMN05216195_111295 [Lentzea flaviverrucosa]